MGFICICYRTYWVVVDVKTVGLSKSQRGTQKSQGNPKNEKSKKTKNKKMMQTKQSNNNNNNNSKKVKKKKGKWKGKTKKKKIRCHKEMGCLVVENR